MNKKLGKYIIIIIGLLTIVFGYFASTLKFDYDFEKFFPSDDKDLEYYNSYRERFENDNDFILIGIENEEGILTSDFLKSIDSFSKEISQLKSVVRVVSPTNVESIVIGPLGLNRNPILDVNTLNKLQDSLKVYTHPELVGSLFSESGKAVSIFVKYENKIGKEAADSSLIAIKQIAESFDFDEIHYAGKSVAEKYYIEMMNWELIIFVSASAVLIIFFLYFSYRSIWGIVLPLTVVLLSVFWCMGVMGLLNKPIDLMTVLLPTIMFIVGISDVIHIISKYLEEIRNGVEKKKALNITIKEIGVATFLTSVTTSIGFLTLLTSSIVTVREFGLYTAIGVVLAFIISFTFLPAVLIHRPIPKIVEKAGNRIFWNRFLGGLFLYVIRNSKKILLSGFVVTVFFIGGITLIEVNAKIIDEVNEGDPLREDFVFFEKEFSGVRPFELNIEVINSQSVFDENVLKELLKIETYLENQFGVGQIVSPLTLVRNLNMSLHGANYEFYTLPERQSRRFKKYLADVLESDDLSKMVTKDLKQARLTGKIGDIGSKEFRLNENQFSLFLSEKIDSKLIKVTNTGSARLIDKSNTYLSKNMLTGLSIAFVLIALIMGLLFRSFKMTFLSLIPNVIPLIMIAGIIGFIGIDLNISISIIFTIAFGIAVDDTIHFLTKFKIELNKGKSVPYALKRTFLSTGKAIIVTSFILMGGFLTLMYSSFNGTFYTGLFISLTLLFAVVSDLLLIPSLFLLLYKNKK